MFENSRKSQQLTLPAPTVIGGAFVLGAAAAWAAIKVMEYRRAQSALPASNLAHPQLTKRDLEAIARLEGEGQPCAQPLPPAA